MNSFQRFAKGFVCLALYFSLVTTAQAGFLYVLNDDPAGSRIYGFNVNETTGALTALTGFPVITGGTGAAGAVSERMAIDHINNRVYVINDGSDTVSAYSINTTTGALTALPFSPLAIGTGTWNSIAVHPSGSPLIIGNGTTGGGAASFNITATTATAAAGSPFLLGAATAFSNTFSRDGNYYYVGGNTGNTIAGFSVNPTTGVLTALTGSPFDTGGANPVAHAVDNAGRLYVFNATPLGPRVFTTSSGIPTAVTGNPFPAGGLTQRRFSLVHPNGNFLIVAGNTGNNVGVFQIAGSGAGTTLTSVIGSPFATSGTTANVIALNQAGTFLFTANRLSRNLTTFSVNTTTGQLTSLVVQPSNTLGTAGFLNGMAYLPDSTVLPAPALFDFDGDAKTDFSVFRNGNWFIQRSTAGFSSVSFGVNTDRVVSADYDGDGKADIAVWRSSAFADFFILQSATNTVRARKFGQTGDLPTVVGDWDGDGRADLAVYRNGASAGAQSFFFILTLSAGGAETFIPIPWGVNGDKPVNGDFDGDGKLDAAVFRPSDGNWYIRQSSNGAFRVEQWGLGTDRLVPADYDNDGKTDLAVFRNGSWFIRNSSNNQIVSTQFGTGTDVIVQGDWDGDGRDDISVWRPSDGNWYRINSGNGSFSAFQFGQNNDAAVPSAYLP